MYCRVKSLELDNRSSFSRKFELLSCIRLDGTMPPIPSSFPGSSTSMSTTSGIVATSKLKQVRVELTNLEAHRSKLSLVLKGKTAKC